MRQFVAGVVLGVAFLGGVAAHHATEQEPELVYVPCMSEVAVTQATLKGARRESLKAWLAEYADQIEARAHGGGATPEVQEALELVVLEIRFELASR